MSCATPPPCYKVGSHLLSDALYTRICPSDLTNRPCEFDNLWRFNYTSNTWVGGCPMLRLCYQASSTKNGPPSFSPAVFPSRLCAPGPALPQCAGPKGFDGLGTEMLPTDALPMKLKGWLDHEHQQHESHCSFLHGIDSTCTFLISGSGKREHQCPVVRKGEICWFGHDFEETRIRSWHSDRSHLQEAHEARNKVGTYWRDGWGRWWRRIEPRANYTMTVDCLNTSNDDDGLSGCEESDTEVEIICE